MRRSWPDATQYQDLKHPAKSRIQWAIYPVFAIKGLAATTADIALAANTNERTVIKLMGNNLSCRRWYLMGLIKDYDMMWDELQLSNVGPATLISEWIAMIENEISSSPSSAVCQLVRAGLERLLLNRSLQEYIDGHFMRQRHNLEEMCRRAEFKSPSQLADKLIFLIHGAAVERSSNGWDNRSIRLSFYARDFMKAHCSSRRSITNVSGK